MGEPLASSHPPALAGRKVELTEPVAVTTAHAYWLDGVVVHDTGFLCRLHVSGGATPFRPAAPLVVTATVGARSARCEVWPVVGDVDVVLTAAIRFGASAPLLVCPIDGQCRGGAYHQTLWLSPLPTEDVVLRFDDEHDDLDGAEVVLPAGLFSGGSRPRAG